jgi:parallel beta-helix repeat protein
MVRSLQTALAACIWALALAAFAVPSAGQAGKGGCTKFAGPAGDDSASGTAAKPYATAQRLADALRAGETGCLRAGTYQQEELTLATSGTRLTSYPGEQATLVGRLRVTADRVTVDGLTLDGRNLDDLNSPTINADDVIFRRNDVSSPGSGGCFILGSVTEIRHPVVEDNRIHDCGEPATLYGHGIYMQDVNDAEIVGNTIYDNADRGIKVGPDSQGALIQGNVIDGNPIGLNFSGEGTRASSDNLVEHNVIANSTRWWNVQTYWPDRVGSGNLVRRNCLHGGNPNPDYNQDGGVSGDDGFTAEGNLVAEPDYFDREAKDFRLREQSLCWAVYASAGGPGYAGPDYAGALAGAVFELQRLIEEAIVFSTHPGLP